MSFIDNSGIVNSKLKKAIRSALDEIGEAVAEHAKENVVKYTGALEDSIDYASFDDHVIIGSTSEYASYVELGTGPYYVPPFKWIHNASERGYHTDDPWWYFDDRDGEWHLGWFVLSRPYLEPAVLDHVDQYRRIVESRLRNA